MARINPDKLVRNFTVRSSKVGQLEAFWDIPVSFVDGEEIVVARRKDAFPVEIRNRNFEDRYTDVVQVEVFKGRPVYCSNLLVNENILTVAPDNTFIPADVTEFNRDSSLAGRLIRDSRGQVFRITSNTQTSLTIENVSTNPLKQAQPFSGEFIILADYAKQARPTQSLELLSNAYTLTVEDNTFSLGDIITINNTVQLEYGVHWTAGASVEQTARNIIQAITSSGVQYLTSAHDEVVLIERGSETTLSVFSNTPSLVVLPYAAAKGKVFIADNTLSKNEVRYLSLQDGDAQFHLIKSNEGKLISLYQPIVVPQASIAVVNSFNNTYPVPFTDNFRGFLDALTRKGVGLENDQFYYYTAFTSPLTTFNVMSNEITDGGENITPYTVDKIASYYTRIFYESIVYLNPIDRGFSYDNGTGLVTYNDAPDLTQFNIQVGDLIADAEGLRYSITDVSNAAIGEVYVAPLSEVSTEKITELHGSITRANLPANFNEVQVGDTFKDIAGNSFPIKGTTSQPLAGVTIPPGNAFDVLQGLVDEVVLLNTFLVPYSYNPDTGKIQYGEETVFSNTQLSTFTYNSVTGVIQYDLAVNLNSVALGNLFIDGADNEFEILAVNPQAGRLTIAPLQILDFTISNRRSASIIAKTSVTDDEGNLLIDLSPVREFDLFKTNGGSTFVVSEINVELAYLFIPQRPDTVSVAVESEFDGSILRRGTEVAWVGFNNEFEASLQSISQGGVKRYGSVTNTQSALFSSPLSTQSFAIHAADRNMGELLYNYFPTAFRVLDSTNDLQDLMEVFGHEFNVLYALITKYELQNASVLTPGVLEVASQNAGFDLVSENLGIDTRRRVMRDIISCYKLKGNRDGIAKFIKVLTTWDITNGTGDTRGAIIDDIPELVGLRFYSASLGVLNTNLVDTGNVQSPPAGRFVKGVPGLALPGFFQVREVIIELPNVALHIGDSNNLTPFEGNTTLSDVSADFGAPNSLVGCYLIPNEGSPNDFFQILENDSTSVTVAGNIPITSLGAKYIILSPLNLTRFVALSTDITKFMPYNTVAVFNFTIKTI
jgi:hypothetical protein